MNKTLLKLKNIFYENNKVKLANINLDIYEKELFVILGQNKSGKTELLNLISGLASPQKGKITYQDKDIVDSEKEIFLDAFLRNIGMVFEDTSLYPHLSIYQNLLFPLENEIPKMNKVQKEKRILETSLLLRIATLLQSKPYELSIDELQESKIAKALIRKPSLILLDAPFKGLDNQKRNELRSYLRFLQENLGITCILTTTNAEDAMRIADRMAIMFHGKIIQVGKLHNLYFYPKCIEVARLISALPMNILNGIFQENKISAIAEFDIKIPNKKLSLFENFHKEVFSFGFYPKDTKIVEPGKGNFDAIIKTIEPYEDYFLCMVFLVSNEQLIIQTKHNIAKNTPVGIKLDFDKIYLFDNAGICKYPLEDVNEK